MFRQGPCVCLKVIAQRIEIAGHQLVRTELHFVFSAQRIASAADKPERIFVPKWREATGTKSRVGLTVRWMLLLAQIGIKVCYDPKPILEH